MNPQIRHHHGILERYTAVQSFVEPVAKEIVPADVPVPDFGVTTAR